jgi:methylated-DNA-[protein]-cysteine S-methyltransferase
MKNVYFYKFQINKKPACKLGIVEEDGAICGVLFDIGIAPNGCEKRETPLIKKAAQQFDEYFDGKRKYFNLPLSLHGTAFQMKVWNALQKIPYGKTISYGELAAIIGNPKASRAVGMANNRNPIPIIIPCHRVIGHDGSLTGYAGGLDLKRELLELEGAAIHAGRQVLSGKQIELPQGQR